VPPYTTKLFPVACRLSVTLKDVDSKKLCCMDCHRIWNIFATDRRHLLSYSVKKKDDVLKTKESGRRKKYIELNVDGLDT